MRFQKLNETSMGGGNLLKSGAQKCMLKKL